VQLYFGAVLITILLQLTGIVLVKRGKNKMGGIFQIVASAPHVLKLEGVNWKIWNLMRIKTEIGVGYAVCH
jgi:hypothetical protein